MLLGNLLLLVATITTTRVKGQQADRRRQVYGIQHDQCSYTILLPELPSCPPNSTALKASNNTQNQLPTLHAGLLSDQQMEQLKNVLKYSTQRLQKLEEVILIILRPDLLQDQQNTTPMLQNQTQKWTNMEGQLEGYILIILRPDLLRDQQNTTPMLQNQTQAWTNMEDQVLNQKSCMEIQMLEVFLTIAKLEKQLQEQSYELSQPHGCNSDLETKLLTLKVQKQAQLASIHSLKAPLLQLLKHQNCTLASIQHNLQAESYNSSLLQQRQHQFLENLKQLMHLTEQSQGAAEQVFQDCEEIHRSGVNEDGVYTIHIPNLNQTRRVFCVMDPEGGAWTIIQRREDGSVDFQRNWEEYKQGFGDPAGEHWLGNEVVHQLTSRAIHSLRVEVEDWEGNTFYANFGYFQLDSEEQFYRIFLDKHSGAALGWGHRVLQDGNFSTHDADHDNCSFCSCAEIMSGGWWFDKCGSSNLNGIYYPTSQLRIDGLLWHHSVHRPSYTFRASRMMMRTAHMVMQPQDSS
ncbi:angiopoietin-4 [Fukomys damarensis]|uniref:Angiopoietin-4 n=1 Tax=Fukomys damarensis TaxID=885580 RepID=A0A091CLV7_FUKDA|nr:angiopoietin-4 [Fukomys damarensis]KFO19754.1 Angiopoietin-4 [Fukomys damarensis]